MGRVFLEKITGYDLSNSSHFDGDINFTTCVLKPTTCRRPEAATSYVSRVLILFSSTWSSSRWFLPPGFPMKSLNVL